MLPIKAYSLFDCLSCSFSAQFLKNNRTYKVGEELKMPNLTRTLEIIAQNGAEAFYDGELSQDIVDDINDEGML